VGIPIAKVKDFFPQIAQIYEKDVPQIAQIYEKNFPQISQIYAEREIATREASTKAFQIQMVSNRK